MEPAIVRTLKMMTSHLEIPDKFGFTTSRQTGSRMILERAGISRETWTSSGDT